MAQPLLAIGIFVSTLVLAMTRPRGTHESVWTSCGALAMIAVGCVRIGDLRGIYDASGAAILFLVALLVLSALVDRSGLFEWAALHAARAAGGSGRALFRNVFLLGAAVTATLSLDTTAVLLTPIVIAFIRRLDVPARPYVIACAFVANAGSLSLPISNLTNLVLVAAFRIPFATFVGRMLPIQVLVLGVTYASLRHHFRSELVAFDATRVATEPSEVVPSQPYFRATLGVLVIALVAYLVAPAAGIQPYTVAFVASGVLAALGVRAGRVDRATVGNISWKVVPFVLGLFVVVQGIEGLGLAEEAARILAAVPGGEAGRILATTASNAIASNVVNNLPASLVARSVLERLHGRDALVYATLVGTNVGPNLVPFGSLASVLVLTTARERGVRVSGWAFARSGLVATPVACVLAALAIAILPR